MISVMLRMRSWSNHWMLGMMLVLSYSQRGGTFDSANAAGTDAYDYHSSLSSWKTTNTLWTTKHRRNSYLTHDHHPSQHHRSLEFGDYAEIPEECPAITTCPVVCVADPSDCPTQCDEGLEWCEWGSCFADCAAAAEEYVLENPCTCEGLTVACPKVIDAFPNCQERFQAYYNATAACYEAVEEEIPLLSFTGPYFLACYITLGGVTVLVFLWGFFNQVLYPVEDSAVDFVPVDKASTWTLTGYRKHWIGTIIYGLTMFVLWGFHFLLFLLTLFYYMQQDTKITAWGKPFEDEVQVLKTFQIVWMVGFFWSFAFRYVQTGLWTVFLRRCTLDKADFVMVVAPTKSLEIIQSRSYIPKYGKQLMYWIWVPFDIFLCAYFSWPYGKSGYDTCFCPVTYDPSIGNRSFYHRMRRYVYEENPEDGSWAFAPGTVTLGERLGDFLDLSQGLSTEQITQRTARVGPNIIPMQKPTVFGLIYKEFSKAFYLYQAFMVWTWAPYWYYYMAIVNTVVRITGGIVVAVFQYISDSVLYQLTNVEGEVTVLRDGNRVTVSNADIVPGDVIVLTTGTCFCDMVVVKADHIVVDESALTGEATPILKIEIDPTMSKTVYDPKTHKSFTISAGTEILEVGGHENDLGLVMTTGSFTSKGKLLTEVLSYQRHKFKFDDEVKFILVLLVIEAFILFGLVCYFLKDQFVYAWMYGIFVVGTVIPPLLPTVFVVSVGISANRLQRNRIACTYPEGILVAGKVNMAFFDKTGTLTKQGLDFISLECDDSEAEDLVRCGMAVCHSLSKTSTGDIVGNHVDQASFSAAGAVLDHKIGGTRTITFSNKKYTILKQFEFDNVRVTQSVIVEDEAGAKHIFVKGSQEAIHDMCLSPTLPTTFELHNPASAKTGVYKLAMGYKKFDFEGKISDIKRDDVESSLTFTGLINFQNLIKEETAGVIKELEEGSVQVAMVTGDNVYTGICVAKEAGIINPNKVVLLAKMTGDNAIGWVNADSDETVKDPSEDLLRDTNSNVDLAVTGKAWKEFLESDPKYAAMIAKHIKVFGRCNPSDKVAVVAHFVERGFITLMCGDGSNDCGSLKTAHVGIALSSSEASVVAPFTSLDKTITSVAAVLREGRCALASAFAVYSYYIIYGQIESYLQTINAYMAITFTEWIWVFMDGIWSTLLAFSLPLARAAKKLSPTRPTASLLGARTLSSVCGMLAWNFLFLTIGLLVLFNADWFQCRKWNSNEVSDVRAIVDNYEASVLFLVGGWQYIATAIALNFGYTWREHWIRNFVFVNLALFYTLLHIFVTTYPSSVSCIFRVNCDNEDSVRWVTTPYRVAILNNWNTTVMPSDFRWKMFGIMAANLVALCVWQYYAVNGWIARRIIAMKKMKSLEKSSNQLMEQSCQDSNQDVCA